MGETIQILELFGGIGSPRCALRNLNIPTKASREQHCSSDIREHIQKNNFAGGRMRATERED